ncbi:MAG: ABC transporter ATP-binding protein [Deltaproteobacteria bacterium]|nr:ABC transporter ATP-binding protein [Deltaproteobacteria bacterium]
MIELIDLHKSFGTQRVLRGVNLTIPDGKITVILGPSGTGKTVLLRHIIRLVLPDRGTIRVDGVEMGKLKSQELNEFRKRFGMLFQQAALFDSLTVEENVAFPLVEHFKERDPVRVAATVRKKLELVGLAEAIHKMPSELSGGMRKRVGLARAIVLEPKIILYDEPTTGLDPITAAAIDNLILSMQKTFSVTSVIISHDVVSAFRVADQVAMLHDGCIVECGAPKDFQRSDHPVVREFLKAAHVVNGEVHR